MTYRDPVTGDTLAELSEQASPGRWLQGDIVEGQLIGQWQEFGPEAHEGRFFAFMAVDANFVCALVNAYRSGALVEHGDGEQQARKEDGDAPR